MDHLSNPPQPTNPTLNPTRVEADRLLGIAEKLLQSKDLTGSREFALLAQETEPLLEGSDQILAITDVLLASESRANNNKHHDWYSILQTERRLALSEPDLLKKNYRRLALLLHPDKNKYPFSETAFKFVADAWNVLSDPSKRTPYDHELSLFSKVDLQHKLPVRRQTGGGDIPDVMPPPHAHTASGNNPRGGWGRESYNNNVGRLPNFWTACPYCYVLYEYPKVYKECCLRCQNCERAFHAAPIPGMPPMVPGKEAYYCCWGFFPLGFQLQKGKSNKVGGGSNTNNVYNNGNSNNNDNPNAGFPNWMPGMFTAGGAQPQGSGFNMNLGDGGASVNLDFSDGSGYNTNSAANAGFGSAMRARMAAPGAKKRGRPRKNPFP